MKIWLINNALIKHLENFNIQFETKVTLRYWKAKTYWVFDIAKIYVVF